MNGISFAFVARLVLIPWAAVALAMAIWTIKAYPPGDWQPVAAAGALALTIVALPMPDWLRICSALLVGTLVRWIAFQSLENAQFFGDIFYNPIIVSNLLAGEGLTVDLPGYGENIRAMFPPVYLLMLAGVTWAGGNFLILNLAADLVASVALYRLSRGNVRIAAAYFLFPSVVLACVVPLKKSLAVALLLVAMLLVRRPLAFGIAAGLVMLTQPAWTPVPIIAFALLAGRRDAIPAVAGAVAVMLPWWIRNAMLFGAFVPLTTSLGFSLWVAVFGTYESGVSANLGELALSTESGRIALAEIGSEPFAYLGRVAKSAFFAFALDGQISARIGWDAAPWVSASAIAANLAWAGLLFRSALAKASPDRVLVAFAIAWLVGIGFGIWLEFGTRHRAFAVPLLLLWIASSARRSREALPAQAKLA